jgi:hypothetical protein
MKPIIKDGDYLRELKTCEKLSGDTLAISRSIGNKLAVTDTNELVSLGNEMYLSLGNGLDPAEKALTVESLLHETGYTATNVTELLLDSASNIEFVYNQILPEILEDLRQTKELLVVMYNNYATDHGLTLITEEDMEVSSKTVTDVYAHLTRKPLISQII